MRWVSRKLVNYSKNPASPFPASVAEAFSLIHPVKSE
jgi:hypothetical protein